MAELDLKAMMEGMRDQLEHDQAEGKLAGMTVDDLADAVSHPKAAPMIAELLDREGRSVAQGEPAPDFTLPWLAAPEAEASPTMTLSDHFGSRPVALIFGSYT